MKEFVKLALIGAIVIFLFDAVSAFISRSTGLAYAWFSIGSFLIQAGFGFLVGTRTKWFFGALMGAVLGLVESTLGWVISWNIGPGKPEIEMNPVLIAVTIVFVIITAAIVGLFGGALSLLARRDA